MFWLNIPSEKWDEFPTGIPYCEARVQGLVFNSEEALQAALRQGGWREHSRAPSNTEGLVIIRKQSLNAPSPTPSPPPAPGVEVISWDGAQQVEFTTIAREVLLPVVGKPIHLYVPHGVSPREPTPGVFQIQIWTGGNGSTNTPASIWGIKTHCRDRSHRPTGTGVVILSDTYAVAEVTKDDLYIHHDLCHQGKPEELQIFRKICEEAAMILTTSPEDREARRLALEAARQQAMEGTYVKLMSGRRTKLIADTSKKLLEHEKEIEVHHEGLIRATRNKLGMMVKLASLQTTADASNEKLAKEWHKMREIPKTVKWEVDSTFITFWTVPLDCTDPRTGKVHMMGEYKVQIPTAGGRICWTNLTRKVDSRGFNQQHHPHIFKDGRACLGNVESLMAQLQAEQEYAALALLCINFIESVNVADDAGKYIDKWPLKEPSTTTPPTPTTGKEIISVQTT